MARLGHSPVQEKNGGAKLIYSSPFRDEKTPSFFADYLGGKWIWKDFGDTGGTVIDFVMRHENFATVKEALHFLSQLYHGDLFADPQTANPHQRSFSFRQHSGIAARENLPDLEFVGVKPLQSPLIFKYLEGRRIDAQRAKQYLVLVHYRNKKKVSSRPYFAFGQQNVSGGYEIRSANDGSGKFKSALICRDVTLWKGSDPASQTVNIFEGMLDHLSLLVMYNVMSLKGDSIIMNAVTSFDQTLEVIQKQGYTAVNLFLDNDETGQKTAVRFQEVLGDLVTDRAQLYAGHKDINAALVVGHQLKL